MCECEKIRVCKYNFYSTRQEQAEGKSIAVESHGNSPQTVVYHGTVKCFSEVRTRSDHIRTFLYTTVEN